MARRKGRISTAISSSAIAIIAHEGEQKNNYDIDFTSASRSNL
jgi:hypothetical protein